MTNIENGIKTMKLENGEYLHFWYANNKNRGRNNCTIIRSTDERAAVSARQTDVISKTTTRSWKGYANLSKEVKEKLGVK